MDDEPQQPEPTPSMPPPPPTDPAQPRGLSAQPVGSPLASGRPVSSRARLGGWLMIAGGAIVIASVFLPRETATAPGGTVTSGGLAGAGFGTLLLAGLAIAKGLQVVRPDVIKMRLSAPLLTGVLMLVLAAIRYSSLQSDVNDLNALPGVTASIGIGFWTGLIGASIVTIGGAVIQFGDRTG